MASFGAPWMVCVNTHKYT